MTTSWSIEVVVGSKSQGLWPVAAGQQMLRVGRAPGAEIQLQDLDAAHLHACLELGPGRALVRDLGTVTGTRVNGHRVTVRTLAAGDSIQIGRTTLRLHITPAAVASVTAPPAKPSSWASAAVDGDEVTQVTRLLDSLNTVGSQADAVGGKVGFAPPPPVAARSEKYDTRRLVRQMGRDRFRNVALTVGAVAALAAGLLVPMLWTGATDAARLTVSRSAAETLSVSAPGTPSQTPQ